MNQKHKESVSISENFDIESEEIKVDQDEIERKQSISQQSNPTQLQDQQNSQNAIKEEFNQQFNHIVEEIKQDFWELQVLHNVKKRKLYINDKGLYKGVQMKPSEFKELVQMIVPLGNYLNYIELEFKDNINLNDDSMCQFSSLLELSRSIKHLEINFKMNKLFTEQTFTNLIVALENCTEIETLVLLFTENEKFSENNLQRLGQMLKKLIRLVNLELEFGYGTLSEQKRQQFCKILQKEKPIPNLKFKFGFFQVNSYQELLKKECSIF
ncbi:hypothetical protein ABPG72_014817 [Tetrahymena utriculariae]